MKRIVFAMIIIWTILTAQTAAVADQGDITFDFEQLFDNHGSVMLLIDSQSGSILYANHAASDYYGYSVEQLKTMKIAQINTLSAEETAQEMREAEEETRNYFIFRHRLANGEIRTVEVFSYPVKYKNQDVLYSIVHDVTAKVMLEEKNRMMTYIIFASGAVVILLLILFLLIIGQNHRKLQVRNKELENFYELRKSFIDAESSLIYLKDENLKYMFVNKATEEFYNKPADDMIGLDDLSLGDSEFAFIRRQSDLKVLQHLSPIEEEIEWNRRVYKINKFPVKMLNGKYGVGAYIKDISKEWDLRKRQEIELKRHTILTNVLNSNLPTTQEQLDFVLNESLKITGSEFGYIYLYDQEKKEFILNSWSKGVMAECAVVEKKTRYQLEKTGIWGEVVRQGKPIVVNNFIAPHPLKKGYPDGHVTLSKFMSIPIVIDDKIEAVMGLANKDDDYDSNDLFEMTVLMNGVWNVIKRREILNELTYERNKYLQILISIGDAVLVVDREGKIEMLNTVAQKLTGWPIEEAQGKHYKDIFILSHEDEKLKILDPIEEVFRTDAIQELGNHAILTARDGETFYIEDSAAPIQDEIGVTIGVVLVFRDVTEKKEHSKKIEFLSFHDMLTGLYNRRFFEEELRRLDTQRNLPISIIMGDVNGLKLTNDVFGHTFGDLLLQKVGDVLRRVCRSDDVIARWGGDEFVVLLPKTTVDEAEQIKKRIKGEFSKEQIQAVKGSISIGYGIKKGQNEEIMQALEKAEEEMYLEKTLERDNIRVSTVETIINALHLNSTREKDHSHRVRELCLKFGSALGLSEEDLRKLSDAAFFHDIGKIALEPKLLNKNYRLTTEEKIEIKKHPLVGYRILNLLDDTVNLSEVVLSHHERWDGLGYPRGIKGEAIPLLSRIIAITESYERITHDLNISAMSKMQAIHILMANAGSQFDPHLTEVFIRVLESENQE